MPSLQSYFYELADYASKQLYIDEVSTCFLKSEDSDFCRLNNSKIRQSGHVTQHYLTLRLINKGRQVLSELVLTGETTADRDRLKSSIGVLRHQLKDLPVDPYLLVATTINHSESIATNHLPDAAATVANILSKAKGQDLVGIYAAGAIYRGFANSYGQRNWYESYNFNFNWSLYSGQGDKAFKSSYAGTKWDEKVFAAKLQDGIVSMPILQKTAKTIAPGAYRVYLAPAAVAEIVEVLSWNGFGVKAQRTKQSALTKMLTTEQRLNTQIHLTENIAEGTAPDFDSIGFTKPKTVSLIKAGALVGSLVSGRSAKEFDLKPSGASEDESPESIDMAPGTLTQADVLAGLDQGIYINNLWYLNYSDRNACRLTGMTRFASFWVEGGKIVAPLNVMRFDDSVYQFFGANLVSLTHEREFMMGASTYSQRSTNSSRLPGALIKDFCFTL